MTSTQTIDSFCPPFGMVMPGRNWVAATAGGYRFGFQSQESDNELIGNKNSINFTFRIYDSRIGRFFSIDPLAAKYSYNSSYAFSENRVIDAIELEGLEAFFIHGMGGSPSQYSDGTNDLGAGENYELANTIYKSYTNNTSYDNTFAWNVGRKVDDKTGERSGGKLNRALQTPKDRLVAAEMLVKHIETVRQQKIASGEITSEEEITLIGFSAGGLVAMQAAAILAEKGVKVNIITVNTSAMEDETSIEHPAANNGINDMLIINTEGDKLTGKMAGANWEYNDGTVPDQYQQVTVQSTKRNGLLKHFAKDIDINSLKTSGAQKLEPVPSENKGN